MNTTDLFSLGTFIKYTRIITIIVVVLGFFLVNVYADEAGYKVQSHRLQGALKEVAAKFNVVIVADPSLDGVVLKEVKAGSVESVLSAILEPLGYTYTKVEDYYLVSGPDSPLTLLAETESSIVPVGFLDKQTREKLGELQAYLTYDETRGIAYIKAPSSKMNQILSKLWELSQTSGELSVVYQLQIIDLGTSSGLDFMFSGKYDSSSTQKGIVITPDQWSSDGTIQAVLKAKSEANKNNLIRQPWLIALPGKTTELSTSLYYRGADIQYERLFKVAITPVKLDPGTGNTISNIIISRDLVNQKNQTSSSSQVAQVQIAEKTNRVSTTVETKPGKREILAVVRQTNERINSSIVFLPFLENQKTTEHRDFMLLLTATPVNIQSTLASPNGLIPVASLGGLSQMEDAPAPSIKRKSTLGFGLGVEDPGGKIDPWLEFSSSLSDNSGVKLSYKTENLYSLSYLYNFNEMTALELTAGNGIGPQLKNAAMIGLVDVKRPTDFLEWYGKYYPLAYLFETKELTWQGVWEVGTRVGSQKFGLSVSALGNSDFKGCRYKLDLSPNGLTWILDYNSIEQEPEYSLGVKMNF